LNLLSVFSFLRSPSINGELGRAGLSLTGRRTGAQQRILVARSLVRVRHLALPAGLSVADRWGALRAQALSWQPFERTEVRYGLLGDHGLINAWDRGVVADQLAIHELGAEKIEWLPEPLMRSPVPDEGLRLIEGVDGVEGQCWKNGVLCASRWWVAVPAESEWLDFARSSGAESNWLGWSALPELERVPLLTSPWLACRSPDQRSGQVQRVERWLVGGVGLALVAASIPVLHEAFALRMHKASVESELASMHASTGQAIKLRDSAIAGRDRANALADDLLVVQPLDVLLHLAEYLPKDGVTLRELDLEGSKLRLSFELSPGISRTAIVERMQLSGWFGAIAELPAAAQPNLVSYLVTLNAKKPTEAPQASGAASSASAAPMAMNGSGRR